MLARAVAVLAATASLVAVLWAACEYPRRPARDPAERVLSWSEYVRRFPWRAGLDPSKAHPGWPADARSVCGSGKCE